MTTLLFFIVLTALLIVSALFSGLTVGISSLNRYELKRKAQLGNKEAKKVYRYKDLGNQSFITLLIGNILTNAIIVVLLSVQLNGLFAVLISTVIVVIFGELLPILYLKQHVLKIASKLDPILKYLIIAFSPVAKPVGRILDSRGENGSRDIYSKEELLNLLNSYRSSYGSEIAANETQIVRHALTFGDKQVREVMVPRRMVVSVSAGEKVSLIMIDELHKSGFSRFPVFEDKKAEKFVGTLYLRDLINLRHQGFVRDIMREVYYVHDEQSLDHALKAFLQTSHHLLVVVNSFEEFVGVLSMEDVIEQIIGKNIVDEFDQHADIREVARSLANTELKDRLAQEKLTTSRLKTSKNTEK